MPRALSSLLAPIASEWLGQALAHVAPLWGVSCGACNPGGVDCNHTANFDVKCFCVVVAACKHT